MASDLNRRPVSRCAAAICGVLLCVVASFQAAAQQAVFREVESLSESEINTLRQLGGRDVILTDWNDPFGHRQGALQSEGAGSSAKDWNGPPPRYVRLVGWWGRDGRPDVGMVFLLDTCTGILYNIIGRPLFKYEGDWGCK